jgi:hypothetical protein
MEREQLLERKAKIDHELGEITSTTLKNGEHLLKDVGAATLLYLVAEHLLHGPELILGAPLVLGGMVASGAAIMDGLHTATGAVTAATYAIKGKLVKHELSQLDGDGPTPPQAPHLSDRLSPSL